MPPMMVTRESSLAEVKVDFPDGTSAVYHLFIAVYNTRDCYFFVNYLNLGELPVTRVQLHKIAELVVECETRHPFKDREGDPRSREVILRAFDNIINVHEVHEL